jgi:transcription elongation factor S-II
MSSTPIKLKIKTKINTSPDMKSTRNIETESKPIHSVTSENFPINNELFNPQIKPFVDKVIDCLSKTQLKADLIHPIEEAIRNKTKYDLEQIRCKDFDTYKKLYMTNARHIIDNLKPDNEINNTKLIENVNNGNISPEKLTTLTPQDMHQERWLTLIEKKMLDIERMTKDPEATTDMFTCNRCHRNKCTYFQRQDRSADEPATIHITCCYCGKKWRI